MAKKFIAFSVSAVLFLTMAGFAFGQSGSRITGASLGGGGTVTPGGGFSTAQFNFDTRRISSAERQALRQQQIAQAQEAARLNAERQHEFIEAQRKQLLSHLGAQPDGALNRKLRRLAFAEAKHEFKALRKMNLAVSAAGGFLQQPFRLPSGHFDLAKKQIEWPKSLQDDAHSQTKNDLQQLLQSKDASATQFRSALMNLGTQLGQRAIEGKIKSNEYARGKRFLTGLAYELTAGGAQNM